MEPIKPIEGILRDLQGQAMALAELAQSRYWQQRSQETPPVESSGGTLAVQEQPAQQSAGWQDSMRETYVEFEVDSETHEVTVRIIDADNGQLIRTVPPDQLAKEIASGQFLMDRLRRITIEL